MPVPPFRALLSEFRVAERADGCPGGVRPLLGLLRWAMVLIFVTFGIQKFTPRSAAGIAVYIRNSPFVSWLGAFGIRGEAELLGCVELCIALLLVLGAVVPLLSALGSLLATGTFAVTWSFFFTTPGVVRWSLSTDPIAWTLAGEFLFKDVVLLCVCLVLLLASLPPRLLHARLRPPSPPTA